MAWDIDLQDATLPVSAVRLLLPPDFPASTCELYVHRGYFLKVPHVEADGHVCLGLEPIPHDYDDPVAAVVRAIRALKDQLLVPASDPQWVNQQFHEERASYWVQRCFSRKNAPDLRPVPGRTYVDVRSLDRYKMGALAAYVPGGSKHRLFALQVATAEGEDPHETAARHRWANGTMVRGNALFVRLPSDEVWTPANWPQTFSALDALVRRLTDNECSLARWLHITGWEDDQPHSSSPDHKKRRRRGNAEPPPGQRPLLVVLVQEGVMFGYQLIASKWQQPPGIEPVAITRIDPDWALARDHQRDVLHARRKKRVLFIGAGSLGSPLAKALARAGIGHLDIVDSQLMETENTSRHELGMGEVGQGKAPALARRLMQEVPGLTATGFHANATTWTMARCKPGMYDLVVECTAESSVRTFISRMRAALFGDCPVIHAWTEPLCSAGHIVLSHPAVPWPEDDPADELVNASDLSASDTRIDLPACSAGFHPYGAADIGLVAAFAAERVIAVLDDLQHPSSVWSWVRSSAFFASLPMPVTLRPIVPISISKSDSATTTRNLSEVLRRA
ncbi:ThiF family adenylyltransferase [Cupriavidus necator]|uniref:ThiF family adenylyltransferase n=1 Tax=Cupriavidus necator TaxID=106590 RepID=UPI003F73FFE0